LLALLGISYEEAKCHYQEMSKTSKTSDIFCHMLTIT
jgi:hypothetical protein